MVTMKLSVSKELKKDMDFYETINWSAVVQKAIRRKLQVLHEMNKLLKNSEITEEDAILFGKKITKKVTKRLKDV